MKIALDARILASPKCGISSYVEHIVTDIISLDKTLEIILFSDSEFHPCHGLITNLPRVKKVIFGSGKKEKKHWIKFLPGQLKAYQADIYHATWNTTVPLKKVCPCLLTVHDLAPWVLGGHFKNKRKEWRYKLRHFLSAHKADFITTVSLNSKNDIVKLCGIKENKIKVIPLGIDAGFLEPIAAVTVESVLARYALTG